MKRPFLFFICLTIISIIICYTLSIPYYSAAEPFKPFHISPQKDDTIRISIIGDSWALLHTLHNCKIDSIIKKSINRNAQSYSKGISGLTSKEIYESIFYKDSIRSLIERGPQYCVVFAGINDTDLKMGKYFFRNNMKLIIDFLINNDVTPIIIEIPHYNIKYSYERRYKRQKLLRLISMIVTGSEMDCIDSYNKTLYDLISDHYQRSTIYIRNEDWNPKGYQDPRNIYTSDLMHITEIGYNILDSCIATFIINNNRNFLLRHKH